MLTLLLDRARIERENHDLQMEQLKVQAAKDRITTLKKAAEYSITVMEYQVSRVLFQIVHILT